MDDSPGVCCGSCGSQISGSARFCSECGTPVARVPRAAEYKQVTVLFADVVHSMDIAAAVGPERLREIMAEVANCCAAVVQRFGGTVDKFTGDGIMAVFGAPAALEDHALRGCLAALATQEDVKQLAAEVAGRDGVELRLRVGLNSGQVIAGEIGSGPFGYTAIGEQVGMAQRMESVAPPGGVMLSESTVRLAGRACLLGDPEMVTIKGAAAPVVAYRLIGVAADHEKVASAQSTLVGRELEVHMMRGLLERAMTGRGSVVGVVGPPGIGKSRLVRESVEIAESQGVEVLSTYCESHASQIPFHAAARLFRTDFRITGLDDAAARLRVRRQLPDADPDDLLLLDDLLGIADPDVMLPRIDPDARRRRLGALINAANLARTDPILYVMEDVHWIDEVSESMMADVLAVISQTPAVAMITYRPEYEGALTRVHGAQTIALSPLADSETAVLLDELMGADRSVAAIKVLVAERAAGNPFFAHEMVRDLAEQGVLEGDSGSYQCSSDIAEVTVPATLQATIAARIDRFDAAAKRTLNAAAVIGSRFTPDLLTALGIDLDLDLDLDGLLRAELIDQVGFTPFAEYAFRHPLIRAVAYESQLKTDRAELHRRVAAEIEARDPTSADKNAALIAEHLEAAGEFRDAYNWHMRAGMWSTGRNLAAANLSWERARRVVDIMPTDEAEETALRIAPLTMLCGVGWGAHEDITPRFAELRELCTVVGDKRSLASGMTGLVVEHMVHARMREASRLASEHVALIESIDDPILMLQLSLFSVLSKLMTAEMSEAQRWSETAIDLADGDFTKGNLIVGSPLAVALGHRGLTRCWQGHPGWRDDLDRAVAISREVQPYSHAYVANMKYGPGITHGLLQADDAALRDLEDAIQIAELNTDDFMLSNARSALGWALVHRSDAAGRERGLVLLEQVHAMCEHGRYMLSEVPVLEAYIARERARRGDVDGGLQVMRSSENELFNRGQFGWFAPASTVLVETLLERGRAGDIEEAEAVVDRLAAAPFDSGFSAVRDIMALRLRTLIANARGDEAAYCEMRDRYRTMANALGFEGHMAWAEAMR